MLTTSGFFLASSSAARRMSSEAIDRAAGRVDPQDHGAHRVVFARLVQRLDHVVRAHPVAAGREHRIESALPALNRAVGVDHREPVAMAKVRQQRDLLVVGVLDDRMVVTAVVLDAVGELVAVLDSVDQMGLEPGLGAERRLVDERAELRGLEMALARGGGDELVEQAARQRFVFFALRGREVLLGEDVGGALVFADRGEVGLDPHLVEQSAREQLLQPHAHQVDLALGHHRDLAGRARDQVGQVARSEVAGAFEIRGGPFVMGREVADEGAQFLGLRELHLRVGDTDRQSHDSRIVGRLAQRAARHVERGLVVVDQSAQAIAAAFDYRALQRKLDHRAGRNAMRPPIRRCG